MATEQLTIEVNYKDYGAQKKVDALTKSFEALNTVTSGKGFTQLNNVAKSLASLGQSLSGISGAGSSLREVAKSASALSTAFKSFDSKSIRGLDRVANALNSINIQNKSLDSVSKLANGLGKLTSAAKDSNLSQNLQTVAKSIATFAQNVVNNISEDTLSRFERLGTAMAGLSSGSGRSFNTSNMSSGAKIASKVFSDLGNNIKKVIKLGFELGKLPFKMILSPIQKVGEGIMGMTNRFTTFLKGIGRIALYRAIRTGIKMVTSAVREGVNNLYIWAGMVGNSFKPTMDSLATSFLYLKNSIGAMVSPLLDALAPALEIVVDQIVDVLNIFNQVIASMTGASTWRKALRAPASYADNISGLGHDAEDAADSVKELKRTILGFDEINKLEDKTKTLVPKNNGKDATGYYAKQGAFSFEEVPITKTALDISKMLKDAWNKADFTEIGDIAAQKIADTLNKINWDKVKSLTTKFSTSLGTFLNGLLDYNGKGGKALWDAVASTIYNGINTAILGYTTFFDTVEWKGIGNGIGSALKDVCENIKWVGDEEGPGLDDALSAFPNAVIDVLTGFTEKFTADDFYNLGNNIGNAVTNALTKIKWKDLFNNTMDISTGILSAFNGLLEGLGWEQIKDSILKGIESVPKKKWADLGKEIGKAIFNVADFVANMADMLVKAVEAGKWKDLVKGIWNGLDKKVKDKYGSWAGAAKELGSWIINHMGTISTLIAIVASFSLAKGIGTALWQTVKTGLIGAGGSVKGGSWTGLVSTLSIAAGVALVFKNWDGKSAKSKIAAAIGGGLVTAGIITKLTACTFTGSLLAFGVGAAITLSIKSLYDTAKECGVTSKKFLTDLAADLIGLGVGFILGGPVGAVLGLTLATTLTLAIEELDLDLSKVGGIGSQNSFGDANGTGDSSFAGSAGWSRDKNLVTSTQDRRYGASNNNSSINVGTITATLDKKTASNAWTQLTKDWSLIASQKKVKEFLTKGLLNKASDWWKSAQIFWSNAIYGKTAKQFSIAGIVNKASEWWTSVKQYWSNKISGQTASKFTIAGIINGASTWWSNVKQYWSETISGKTASKFTIGGVVNKAKTWWSNTKTYWSEETDGKSLKAKVSISNASSVASSAWKTISDYFKLNPITATVKASVTTATTAAKNYQKKTGYIDSNGVWNLPTPKAANGGVYKNGQWHDVTAFASGGMPGNSGQVFLAREAGPELVGTIGGNTAVLNNDQIVASVSAGVAQAVASVLGGGNTNEITINVDSETLYRAVRKGERMASGRYGTAIAIG